MHKFIILDINGQSLRLRGSACHQKIQYSQFTVWNLLAQVTTDMEPVLPKHLVSIIDRLLTVKTEGLIRIP